MSDTWHSDEFETDEVDDDETVRAQDVAEAQDDREPGVGPTVTLNEVEARVLGALIEKSFLTPDVYPMTTNGLVTACNQKTNRDPVVAYTPVIIDGALLELRQRNLVRRVHTPGSRSTKHRQTLDEALSLSSPELAVLSVLMLRGAQTVGELRLRTERHGAFETLDAADRCLDALAARRTPLVRQLARQPGQKEARWLHLLGDPDAVPTLDETAPAAVPVSTSNPAPTITSGAVSQEPVLAERVDVLEAKVATLQRQLATLASQLGETLEP